MYKAIKIFLAAVLIMGVSSGAAGALPAYAAPLNIVGSASQTDACAGLQELDSTQSCASGTSGDTAVNGLVTTVVNILSYIVGIASVIMIIVSGIRYITSGGDSNRTSSAKNALIYALIGLLIAALAQVIVKFVLTRAINPTAPGIILFKLGHMG